jgi:hypothetical protein
MRRADLMVRPLDKDLVMADLETGNYYGLTGTARAIWALLEEPATVEAICEQMSLTYQVDRPVLEREVLAFLEALRHNNLICVPE